MTARPARTGVWFIGARGSVATTAVAGCAAVTAGLHPATGMVTETPPFVPAGLPPLASLVFGGHDTASCPLPKRAEALAEGGVLPHGLPSAVRSELAAADREIRPGGPLPGDTRTDEELVTAFAADLTAFVRSQDLARAVVVNVSSTEPAPGPDDPRLPASSLYAAAALRAGCPYVNFTPSTGLRTPALAVAAGASGLPYAGRDGKTGQTLLRSVLAPMFAQRALSVRAWSGSNLLGGGDGAALADPAAAAAKNAGKERVLTDTLGAAPEGRCTSTTCPCSATGRRPGTTSPSTVSSAPAWSSRRSGRAATRHSRRRWCWTWPGWWPAPTRRASPGRCPHSASTSRIPTGSGRPLRAVRATPCLCRAARGGPARGATAR